MLVWHDTQHRRMATPEWLPDPMSGNLVRLNGHRGDLLCVGAHNAALLGWREDIAWSDAGDGWAVAAYGDPCIDDLLRPDQRWSLVARVVDGRDRSWLIPALLSPTGDASVPGAPLVDQARRLTAQGWVREPLHERQRHAVEAAMAAFPHLDQLGSISLDTQGSWLGAMIDAVYYGGGLSFAVLGLFDDVLFDKGLRIGCGRVEDFVQADP